MIRHSSKNLEDVRDSKLLYEKTLPHFGYIMILIIVMLLIAVVIWSLSAHKTYMVKGSGTVVSENKNYIMSNYTGTISKINIKEGSIVKEGDELLTVESTDLDLQKEQLTKQLAIYETKISQYNTLKKCIKNSTNYFSSTSSEDQLYYNQYMEYKGKIEQQLVNTEQLKAFGYTDEQIAEEVKKNEAAKDQLYYSTLQTIDSNITGAQDQIDVLNIQIVAAEEGASKYTVKANSSGIVHMIGEFKEGMVVQAASAIGSIANENEIYYIVAYVSASDLPLINLEDEVDIAISGLNESVYDTMNATVYKIDSDITVDSESEKSFFKVYMNPNEEFLISKSGDKVDITNGMNVEARIKYDKITYFDYVMESIGVLTR